LPARSWLPGYASLWQICLAKHFGSCFASSTEHPGKLNQTQPGKSTLPGGLANSWQSHSGTLAKGAPESIVDVKDCSQRCITNQMYHYAATGTHPLTINASHAASRQCLLHSLCLVYQQSAVVCKPCNRITLSDALSDLAAAVFKHVHADSYCR
jgi:hypothetical protein